MAEPARQVAHLRRALVIALVLAVVAGGAEGFIGYRSYRIEAGAEGWREKAGPSPSPRIRELTVGGTVPAWYVAPRNGAAILYVHGWGASRDQEWPEAREAEAAGFGVLLIDLPVLDARSGVDWASASLRAVEAGVDFLVSAPGVRHVGAQAFSAGCGVLLQAAAADARIEAVAVLAPYSSARDHLDYEYRRWGFIAQWAARAGARRAGYRVEALDSRAAVRKLAGRPLLVVSGDADTVIPFSMSKALFEAAAEPKRFWPVPGAGHGNYAKLLGDRYFFGLREFFAGALLRN